MPLPGVWEIATSVNLSNKATITHTSIDTLDGGKLLLRFVLAAMLLLHGISKMPNGIGFVADMVAKAGLPVVFGYGIYTGEVIAPLFILVDLFTPAAALVIAINMLVAVLLVHTSQFFTINDACGWALALQGMHFFSAIVIALLGAGPIEVGGKNGRLS